MRLCIVTTRGVVLKIELRGRLGTKTEPTRSEEVIFALIKSKCLYRFYGTAAGPMQWLKRKIIGGGTVHLGLGPRPWLRAPP